MGWIRSRVIALYWTVTAGLFAGAVIMLVAYAPIDPEMGPPQKIFYLHWPVAIDSFLACFVVFVASIGYLWQRDSSWDDLAIAGCRVAIVYCTAVLVTGVIWARSVWGIWWTWSPRFTFSLVLLLLYVGYLVMRPMLAPAKRASVAAVYGVVAFVDVPLVYLSVKLMPDVHPTSIPLAPAMKVTLLAWFVPVTLLMIGLVAMGFDLSRRQRTRGRAGTTPAGLTEMSS